MNARRIILIIAVLVLIGLGIFIFSTKKSQTTGTAATSPMLADQNAIVVNEQQPGTVVTIADVYLAGPGFVVIHEDNKGTAGTVIGASALLSGGESVNVPISLSRAMRSAEHLHAMLHADANGDGIFDAAADGPVGGSLGSPIEQVFSVSSSTAATTTPVNL